MMPPREGMNVLDWLIDISVVDVRTTEKEEESRERVARLAKVWQTQGTMWNDKEYEKNEDGGILSPVDRLQVGGTTPETFRLAGGTQEYVRPGVFTQTRILTHRFVFIRLPPCRGVYLRLCSAHSM
jgi:hypothetical protein